MSTSRVQLEVKILGDKEIHTVMKYYPKEEGVRKT